MGGCTADDKSYNLFTKYHFNSKQAQYRQCEKCPVPHYTFNDITAPSKNKMIKLSGTNYCMDMTGRSGNKRNIYIWQCNQNNRNQRFWQNLAVWGRNFLACGEPASSRLARNGRHGLVGEVARTFPPTPSAGTCLLPRKFLER